MKDKCQFGNSSEGLCHKNIVQGPKITNGTNHMPHVSKCISIKTQGTGLNITENCTSSVKHFNHKLMKYADLLFYVWMESIKSVIL